MAWTNTKQLHMFLEKKAEWSIQNGTGIEVEWEDIDDGELFCLIRMALVPLLNSFWFSTKGPVRMPSGADGNFCSPRPPASFSDQASSPSQQPEAMVNALKVTCLAVWPCMCQVSHLCSVTICDPLHLKHQHTSEGKQKRPTANAIVILHMFLHVCQLSYVTHVDLPVDVVCSCWVWKAALA